MRRYRSTSYCRLVSLPCSYRAWRHLFALMAGVLVLAPYTACGSRYRGRAKPASTSRGTARARTSRSTDDGAFLHPSASLWYHLRREFRRWDEAGSDASCSYGQTAGRIIHHPRDVRCKLGEASPLQSVQTLGTNSSFSQDSPGEIQSVEGQEVRVILTEAGGRPHSIESRRKISEANKGKKPWNVGVSHSEETRRKIAEGAREAARRRKESVALSLGYTLEEYERMQADKRDKKMGERKTHVSEEVRRKLSERLKERWRDPEYRERRSTGQRGTTRVPHSEETKARISEAVKQRWKDPVYREKIVSRVQTQETRSKIGRIVKAQWADPETRKDRMAKMQPKSDEHRKRIAESVRAKWADPEFRNRTVATMQATAQARIVAMGGVPKAPRKRRARAPRMSPEEALERKEKRRLARTEASNRSQMARQHRMMKAEVSREHRREEKTRVTEDREAARMARIEAARAAKEEEDQMLAGLDEVDALLMRQQLRLKRQGRRDEALEEGDEDFALEDMYLDYDDELDVDEEPRPRRRRRRTRHDDDREEQEFDVPDGFEMVMQNGRMVLRMI